ncbi:hypothetical protein A2U01_0063243, partial [Trifolium medium]|nr:hypothetical protein [Trifolium medium]
MVPGCIVCLCFGKTRAGHRFGYGFKLLNRSDRWV